MLARRFGVVCVVAAVFGVLMSMIVNQSRSDGWVLRQPASSRCASQLQTGCLAEIVRYSN